MGSMMGVEEPGLVMSRTGGVWDVQEVEIIVLAMWPATSDELLPLQWTAYIILDSKYSKS